MLLFSFLSFSHALESRARGFYFHLLPVRSHHGDFQPSLFVPRPFSHHRVYMENLHGVIIRRPSFRCSYTDLTPTLVPFSPVLFHRFVVRYKVNSKLSLFAHHINALISLSSCYANFMLARCFFVHPPPWITAFSRFISA